MLYFLGLDGGQSSTTALVGDQTGRVLGKGRSGPCNHVKSSDGREKFLNALSGSIGDALAAAGLPRATRFTGACLGFSGGPADKQALIAELITADHLVVTHDGYIAQVGAAAGEPGIIAIAGTGSFIFGRNAAGRTARAGGWGYLFGDEGGAFDIVRQALRAALRMEEGWGPPTVLREHLLAASDARDTNDCLHRFYTVDWPRTRIAACSRFVDEAAHAGDAVAQEILTAAAQHLAAFVGAARAQLFQPGEPARISPIGGVWKSDLLRTRFQMLVELTDGNTFGQPAFGPAAGALLAAYQLAGHQVQLSHVPEEK